MSLWSLWLGGCLWVTPLEHAQNQRDLLNGPADTDTDSDVDSDTDTDTDTDTATDTGTVVRCVDDAFEDATGTVGGGDIDGVLCPEDDDVPGALVDVYPVALGPEDVLVVQIDGRADTACGDLTAQLSIRDASGVPFPDAALDGGCGTVRAGWGAGVVQVWVTDVATAQEQRYELSMAINACRDLDGDTFLSDSCGGPDCNDDEETWYPGAPDPQDGTDIDQDCDGGDDLAPLGCEIATGTPVSDDLACGDLATAPVWDAYTVPVLPGATISVVADNGGGDADLVALVVDPDGTSHFGLAEDRGQLDDEGVCQTTPWSGGACPAGCVAANSGGDATVWIAQHPGTGCQNEAPYQLLLYVDSLPVVPVLQAGADDVVLPVTF